MSGELEKENQNEGEVKVIHKKTLKERCKEQWQVGIKILELIICAICLGFIYDPAKTTGLGKSHMNHVGIMYTAYTGYMLINCAFLISRAIKDRIPFKTSVIFSVSGSAIFLITGILLAVDRSYLMKHYFFHPEMYLLTMLTTSIVFAFVNVIVFAIDAVFTFKRQEDF